jgi:hypothetical protein
MNDDNENESAILGDVTTIRDTPKAGLARFGDGSELWVPKRQIEGISQVKRAGDKGSFNFEGHELRLVAWKRVSKSGREYLSLAIDEGPPRGEKKGGREAEALDQAVHGMADSGPPEDDIPF